MTILLTQAVPIAGAWRQAGETIFGLDSSVEKNLIIRGRAIKIPIDLPEKNLPRSIIVTEQIHGRTPVLMALTDKTLWQTIKAPGCIAMVQVGIVCADNAGTGGAVNAVGFQAAIQLGLNANDGRHILTGTGAAATLTPLTFGSTNVDDFKNPGGGNATGMILDASGTQAAGTLEEGVAWSDWVVAPDECFTATGYITCRVYSSSYAPGSLGNDLNASNYPDAEPDLNFGYWYGNATTSATYDTSASAQNGYGGMFRFRFLLTDQRAVSLISDGDSTMQGYTGGISATNPLGRLNGYPRLVRNAMRAEGKVSGLCSLSKVSEPSSIFHKRLEKELKRGGYTHAFIQTWSVNDPLTFTTTPYGLYAALARSNRLIEVCKRNNVKPIMIEPLNGGGAASVMPQLWAQMASWDASGIAVLRLPDIIGTADRMFPLSQYDSGDTTHPNAAGHQAISNYVIANRNYYSL